MVVIWFWQPSWKKVRCEWIIKSSFTPQGNKSTMQENHITNHNALYRWKMSWSNNAMLNRENQPSSHRWELEIDYLNLGAKLGFILFQNVAWSRKQAQWVPDMWRTKCNNETYFFHRASHSLFHKLFTCLKPTVYEAPSLNALLYELVCIWQKILLNRIKLQFHWFSEPTVQA